jgi:hypothetical protein
LPERNRYDRVQITLNENLSEKVNSNYPPSGLSSLMLKLRRK